MQVCKDPYTPDHFNVGAEGRGAGDAINRRYPSQKHLSAHITLLGR